MSARTVRFRLPSRFSLQNHRIGTRIALALALPLGGLLALSLWIVFNYFHSAHELGNTRRMAQFAPVVSALAHAVQKERAISIGVTGLRRDAFLERLAERYYETDARIANLEQALGRFDAQALSGSLASRIARAQVSLGRVTGWRAALAEDGISSQELTANYGGLITELIGIVQEMLAVGTRADMTRTITAFTHLLQVKERYGLERAIGVKGFSAGSFLPADRTRFAELIDQQWIYLAEFRLVASPEQATLLDRVLAGEDAARVDQMRRSVLAKRPQEAKIDALDWHDAVTRKIDQLKTVEDRVAADLITQASAAEVAATRTAIVITVLAGVLLTLAISFAVVIARGIVRPLQRITGDMDRLAASDSNVAIEDDRRGDEIGEMARAMLVFRDNLRRIAQAEERLKNDAVLRRKEGYQRALLDNFPFMVWLKDAESRFLAVNRVLAEGCGASDPEALVGKSDHDILPRELADRYVADDRAVIASRRRKTVEEEIVSHGERKWIETFKAPLLDEKGEVLGTVGFARDITERKQADAELRVAAAVFESQVGMLVTDAGGVILSVNRAFTEITGYSIEDAVGQTPRMLKSGRHDAAFYAAMWGDLKRCGRWQGEVWDKRKNGEIYPKWLTITAVKGEDGAVTHYVATHTDITDRKAAEEQIHNLAFLDPLTELPNRRLLLDHLRHALAVRARGGREGALLFIDLDHFKTLNDTLGHDMGDRLLREVAQRLTACVREGDTVARLGGDEFVVMLEDLSVHTREAAAQAEAVGEKILATLSRPYELSGHEHHSTPSIGITLFGSQRTGIEEVLKRADVAMYQAKLAGRNTICFFDPAMQAQISARVALENDLREAVREGQFALHYQVQVDGDGRIHGAESLIRWHHPRRGNVSPVEFIPLAEESGLILPIGHWVLETACRQLASWARRPETAHLNLAVNVSARQFRQEDFVDQVLGLLAQTGADPHRLKLELTESHLLEDIEGIIARMVELQAHGVGFSLDDFGTGYSSLSYLKRLPLDQLKIDRSFVQDVLSNPNDAAIVRTVVALGQTLGLAVIAEGVETAEQRDFLASAGCHAYQGYLFGRPLPLDAFETLLREKM